ncbi:MAG: ASCH domain-containing protein [Sphingobium sp.]|nr:ASCH domain-containing protein [Sphingobium sp.]
MTSRTLNLPIKGEYFDQIKSGEKLEEFRLRTHHWCARLNKKYDHIVLMRGYPKGGGVEGETRLTRKWLGYIGKTITHPHFGPDPVKVFAIDVSQPATPALTTQAGGDE